MGGTSDPAPPSPAVESSAVDSTPVADTPALAAVRALWKGALCTDPKKADAQLTALLAQTEQSGQANTQGQAAASAIPEGLRGEMLALRGLARSELGMKDEGVEDLTAAVRQHPVPRNYAWRALALWRAGNARGAQVDAQYALRKDKGQAVAHMVLGMAALQAGDSAAACPELRTACEGGECSGLEQAQAMGKCPK